MFFKSLNSPFHLGWSAHPSTWAPQISVEVMPIFGSARCEWCEWDYPKVPHTRGFRVLVVGGPWGKRVGWLVWFGREPILHGFWWWVIEETPGRNTTRSVPKHSVFFVLVFALALFFKQQKALLKEKRAPGCSLGFIDDDTIQLYGD